VADLQQLRDLMPFAAQLGIELEEASADLVVGKLEWREDLCTAGGVLHGGALMAFADSLGAVCAFLNLPEGSSGTATTDSKTNLLRPVTGGVVTATTTPLHRGRTLAVLETEMRDDEMRLVAKTTQTQAFLRGASGPAS
jgi:uncharacterized protein (TIGR00369 family)